MPPAPVPPSTLPAPHQVGEFTVGRTHIQYKLYGFYSKGHIFWSWTALIIQPGTIGASLWMFFSIRTNMLNKCAFCESSSQVRTFSHRLMKSWQHRCYWLHGKCTEAVSGLFGPLVELCCAAHFATARLRREAEAPRSAARFPSGPHVTIDCIYIYICDVNQFGLFRP